MGMDIRAMASRVASHHQSEGYDLTFKVTEVRLSVSGDVGGRAVSGTVTLYGRPGEWEEGFDYEPDEGSLDVREDPEGALQVVLDAAAEAAEAG